MLLRVLDRQHHAAAAHEVLVHLVEIRVRVEIVKARQHLPPDAAVREDHRAAVRSLRHKELPERLLAVGAGEFDERRLDEIDRRKRRGDLRETGGHRGRRAGPEPGRGVAPHHGRRRRPARRDVRNPSARKRRRRPLTRLARGDRSRCGAVEADRGKMASPEITDVRRIDKRRAIERLRDGLDFAVARREPCRGAARGRHRVEVPPAVFLPRERDAIVRGPEDLLAVGALIERVVDGADARIGVPHFVRLERRDVDLPDRPRHVGSLRAVVRVVVDRDARVAAAVRLTPERHALAVGRPHRIVVARVRVRHDRRHARCDVVDLDPAAPPDGGDARAVRRKAQAARAIERVRLRRADADQTAVRPRERCGERAAGRRPDHRAIVGREARARARAEKPWRVVVRSDDPDLRHRRLGQSRRIRAVALPIHRPAAHERDRAALGRHHDVREILPVVAAEVRDAPRGFADAPVVDVAIARLARDVRDRLPVVRRRGRIDDRRRDDRRHREAFARPKRRRLPGVEFPRRERPRQMGVGQPLDLAHERDLAPVGGPRRIAVLVERRIDV